jgi:hypothetical protein
VFKTTPINRIQYKEFRTLRFKEARLYQPLLHWTEDVKLNTIADYNLRNAAAQLVEALHEKPEDRGFNSRWSSPWDFSLA